MVLGIDKLQHDVLQFLRIAVNMERLTEIKIGAAARLGKKCWKH